MPKFCQDGLYNIVIANPQGEAIQENKQSIKSSEGKKMRPDGVIFERLHSSTTY